MIARTAFAAALVLAAGACTSGGSGTSSAGPTRPAASSPSPSPTTSPARSQIASSPRRTVSGAPRRASASGRPSAPAFTPPPPVACSQLPRSLGPFRRGGSLPSGVPLPQAVPSVVCAGSQGAVAAVWRNVTGGPYIQQLTGTGWTASGGTYRKAHAPRTITVTSVRGALVAVYRPS